MYIAQGIVTANRTDFWNKFSSNQCLNFFFMYKVTTKNYIIFEPDYKNNFDTKNIYTSQVVCIVEFF